MYDIDDSLGFLLNRAALTVRARFEEGLDRHGLTAPQWAVLARLWQRDGVPQSEIAHGLGMDKATVSGIVRRLEGKGLVAPHRDERDRRVYRVFLTDAGRAMEHVLPDVAAQANDLALKGFTAAEAAGLKDALRRVFENCRRTRFGAKDEGEPSAAGADA